MLPIARTLALAGLLFALHGYSTAEAKEPIFDPPRSYYLALGDSVAYGYQASKFSLPPSAVNTGYVDDFGAMLRHLRPRITTVNYGCPGETMASFITGYCPWTALGHQLHDSFAGSQLDAAVSFLRTHRGKVSPNTLTLWGNDVAAFVSACNGAPTCIQNGAPSFLEKFGTSLSVILQSLRAAAPHAEIIVTGSWDSFIGSFDLGDPLFEALNKTMAVVAAQQRVRFADPFPTFNPQGDVNAETRAMCLLTLLCTNGDSHPSDIGYKVLADIVFDASDYADLLDRPDDED